MKYSVIIPIYNAEKTLERCIDSLVMQGRDDVELLLINDGSTDRSGEICCNYQQKHKNICYFYQKNRGVSAARNVGLAKARGEYVLFVDSDDFVSLEYFKIIDNALVQRNADLLLFGKQYTSGKNTNPEFIEVLQKEEMDTCKKVNYLFRSLHLNALHARIFRREIIQRLKLRFQENLLVGEDALFVFGYALHIQKLWVENIQVYHVDVSNGESLTRKFRPYLCEQFLEIHRRMFVYMENCTWPENEKQMIRASVTWSYYRSVYSVCKDLRKSNMTPKERRKRIRSVCSWFLEESIKPADWKCRLIAVPVQMRMAAVIDWLTGLH